MRGRAQFKFKHEQYKPPIEGGSYQPIRGRTDCLVDVPTIGIHSGYSECSVHDVFRKAIGRKVALTRAIADLPRITRKMVWDDYKSLTGLA